ncbi:unnamed protein product [Schistocephalus solidus]|uniref:Uncharacterized protein n=1 Tax=Schistocephalus solidus TaxID=70667 RepID=A0A183TG91_SCHSO|nr:unnamed protein product [Schistocephalus solidus]
MRPDAFGRLLLGLNTGVLSVVFWNHLVFRYLYSILQKNYAQSDCNADQVVESLRLFSEILVWGDQNDGSIMEYVAFFT